MGVTSLRFLRRKLNLDVKFDGHDVTDLINKYVYVGVSGCT